MKFLFTILSMLLLGLTVLPCGDQVECNPGEQQTISSTHSQHKHQSEACSVFCTCNCCASLVDSYPLQKLQAAKVEIGSEKHRIYDVVAKTEVFYTIWQPPKIS